MVCQVTWLNHLNTGYPYCRPVFRWSVLRWLPYIFYEFSSKPYQILKLFFNQSYLTLFLFSLIYFYLCLFVWQEFESLVEEVDRVRFSYAGICNLNSHIQKSKLVWYSTGRHQQQYQYFPVWWLCIGRMVVWDKRTGFIS